MRVFSRPKRVALVGLLLGIAFVVAAYASTARRLSDARQSRRDDECGLAEGFLAACWRLPGLANSIALENQLIAVQQGDLRDEKALLSRTVGLARDRMLILEALAKGNLATFKWAEAQNHAESILKQHPADARALWLRGLARVEMQQEALARIDFEKALTIEPDAFEIRKSLAEVLHKLGHVREAIDQYHVLRSRRPSDDRVILALAHCWQEQTCYDEARELLDELLARVPESISGLVERSRLAIRTHDPEAAELSLRRAVALNPDHADANFVLRLALQGQQKNDESLDRRIDQNDRRQAELKWHRTSCQAPSFSAVLWLIIHPSQNSSRFL
ncbi:MAG: tetratricopeptide repeat protein [Pirellula sp.]